MPETLSEIRERIHRKSHEYFVFDYGRREPVKWRMFYGATDALLDAGMAAASYHRAIASDTGVNLLVCYGFLQALYVQQDAVFVLSRAVGLDWHPNMDERLQEIRDVRNRLTGHPALAGEKDKSPRLSSAVIGYGDITQKGFRGHVYYNDQMEDIGIEVSSFLRDNEARLVVQMRAIENKMDEEEQKFRAEQAAHPLSGYFDNGFAYLVERLHCDLDDEGRVGQAQTHVRMIRERFRKLQQELTNRDFESKATSFHLERIFTGLSLLERFLNTSRLEPSAQSEFDIIYDGLTKHVDTLIKYVGEIDAKLRSPV
jgi:hypothetical protein